MKLYFSILLSSIFCLPYADISSETLHDLQTIGQTNGYFAFYKSGPTGFLANFANCPNGVYYKEHNFKNSEAAYQWAKYQLAAEHNQNFEMMCDPEMDQFFEANGEEAYQLRKIFDEKYKGIYPKNWLNSLRDEVMWQVLEAKFQQNPNFAELLLATRPFYLVEHTEREGIDTYWSDDFTGKGFNMLGKMLMAIREGHSCPMPYDDSDRKERIRYAEDFYNKNPYAIF